MSAHVGGGVRAVRVRHACACVRAYMWVVVVVEGAGRSSGGSHAGKQWQEIMWLPLSYLLSLPTAAAVCR